MRGAAGSGYNQCCDKFKGQIFWKGELIVHCNSGNQGEGGFEESRWIDNEIKILM